MFIYWVVTESEGDIHCENLLKKLSDPEAALFDFSTKMLLSSTRDDLTGFDLDLTRVLYDDDDDSDEIE